MKRVNAIRSLHVLLVMAIFCILLTTFSVQYFLGELPCPLCFLQRFGMMAIMIALIMNIRFGFKPSHYAMILLASFYTGMVALRQVSLHVMPGRGAYGDAILGFHLYTWCFIASIVMMLITIFMMSVDKQYQTKLLLPKSWEGTGKLLLFLAMLLLIGNMVGFYIECGWYECVDNPTVYANFAL